MNAIRNSKILVTGGAGFIGSNLIDLLIEDNEIVVVDDLSMGKIENLPQSSHLHFFEHSIVDSEFMKDLLIKWNFDYIFLFAAVASVADTIQRPMETHEINQNANINILEIIRTNSLNVKKVLFSSSAAVYGNNPELPKKETSPIDPLSPYAIDKFATERFTIDYGRLYNIPTVCTRFFNVYGPKQNPESPYSGVISLIKAKAKAHESFTLFGDGKQTRDFVYVGDVVSALVLLMTEQTAIWDVYNVATGIAVSLKELIRVFEKVSGLKVRVVNEKARQGDVQHSLADIAKLENLGYTYKWNLERGLRSYWQESNYRN